MAFADDIETVILVLANLLATAVADDDYKKIHAIVQGIDSLVEALPDKKD